MAERPIIAVSEVQLSDEEDWYTPKVLKIAPLQISVTLGKKGSGRLRCEIEEGEWERRHVDVRILVEASRHQRSDRVFTVDFHSTIENGTWGGMAGTFDRESLDRLISVLMVAREEAEKRGLFTSRPTPTRVEQVVAAAAHT